MLRPGGRLALAVWDAAEAQPVGDDPDRALVELGHAEPPDPNAPGMFALADPGRLPELLEEAGFVEVVVDSVDLDRGRTPDVDNTSRRRSTSRSPCSREYARASQTTSAESSSADIERRWSSRSPSADGSLHAARRARWAALAAA